jgi:hypothetical protein
VIISTEDITNVKLLKVILIRNKELNLWSIRLMELSGNVTLKPFFSWSGERLEAGG